RSEYIMSKSKSIIFGVAVGSAVGVIATLLTTPSSGKQIRSRVKEQTSDWREVLDSLKFDGLRLKDQLAETSRECASMMKNLTAEMKRSIDEWKRTVEPHKENIQDYIEQIEASLKELEEKVKQD